MLMLLPSKLINKPSLKKNCTPREAYPKGVPQAGVALQTKLSLISEGFSKIKKNMFGRRPARIVLHPSRPKMLNFGISKKY